jgi:hypothetical protein
MAATHASGSLVTSALGNCAVGSPVTSTTLDNATAYGAVITAKVTNPGTAPTLPCVATVNISPDGTTWYFYSSQSAGTSLGGTFPMAFLLPPEFIKAQIVFAGNTGQPVTVEAQYQQLTGI